MEKKRGRKPLPQGEKQEKYTFYCRQKDSRFIRDCIKLLKLIDNPQSQYAFTKTLRRHVQKAQEAAQAAKVEAKAKEMQELDKQRHKLQKDIETLTGAAIII